MNKLDTIRVGLQLINQNFGQMFTHTVGYNLDKTLLTDPSEECH